MSQVSPPEGTNSKPNQPDHGAAEGTSSRFKLPTIPIWAKLLLVLAVVFLASIGYFGGQLSQEPIENSEVAQDAQTIEKRQPAPDTEFNTKAGGAIKLSSLKGKVVLLSFWAHWCTPCLVELPSFKVLHQRLNNPDFVVVPINIDERDKGQEFIKNFWESKSLPFDTYFDPDKNAAKAFRVETLPANFVLDRESRVVMASFGSNDWSNDSTVEMIESLLNEK